MSFRRRLMMAQRQGGGGGLGYYTIDQTGTYSDPAQMVRDRNVSGIQAIRNASHLYVGEYVNGVLQCKQVSDSNKALYADGTPVIYNDANDLFMKLPQFWWKIEDLDNSGDIVKLSFTMEEPEDNTWFEWEGDNFIGAYVGYIDTNNHLRSISGVSFTTNKSLSNLISCAESRGNGYSINSYYNHKIMCLLGWGYLGTLNARSICGNGVKKGTTGENDALGMADTGSGSPTFVNFWGLEGWWSSATEYITGISSYNGVISLNDIDSREITVLTKDAPRETAMKMYFGKYADVIRKDTTTSTNSYYTTFARVLTGNRKPVRSQYNGTYGYNGLSSIDFWINGGANSAVGARLTYKGNYTIT